MREVERSIAEAYDPSVQGDARMTLARPHMAVMDGLFFGSLVWLLLLELTHPVRRGIDQQRGIACALVYDFHVRNSAAAQFG